MTAVKLLAEIYCGHTVCDIHDDHNAIIRLEQVTYRQFNVIIKSNCFGKTEYEMIRTERVAEVLREWSFLPHTRRAIRALNGYIAKFDADVFCTELEWNKRGFHEQSEITPPEVESEPADPLLPLTLNVETEAVVQAFANLSNGFRDHGEQVDLFTRWYRDVIQAAPESYHISPIAMDTGSDYSTAQPRTLMEELFS